MFPLMCGGRLLAVLSVTETRLLLSGILRARPATVKIGVHWAGCRASPVLCQELSQALVHNVHQCNFVGFNGSMRSHSRGSEGFHRGQETAIQ